MATTCRVCTALSLLLLGISAELRAQQPVGSLHDLVGERVASGETQMRNRGYELMRSDQKYGSWYGYWLEPRENRCVSVRSENDRFAMIVYAPLNDCRRDVVVVPPVVQSVQPPVSSDDNFETVCGIDNGKTSRRFRCRLRNEGCKGEGYCRSVLTMPDNELTIIWHKDDRIDVSAPGVRSQNTTSSFSDGQTRFGFGGNSYFVYRSPERARRELASLPR